MDKFSSNRADGDWNGMKHLIECGTSVDSPGLNCMAALHLVAAIREDYVDVVRIILESGGVDVNASHSREWMPLIWAAKKGNKDIVELLVRAGADIHRRDTMKRTALHWASANNHITVVQVFLESDGLNLNPQDQFGETPLHKAGLWGHQEMVQLLLVAGADPNIKDDCGTTVLNLGMNRNFTPETIRLLVEHGAFVNGSESERISQNSVLRDILKNVDFCTRSIVNRFHHQSLPALKDKIDDRRLPNIKMFYLDSDQVDEVEKFVRWDIQTNTFCNVGKARPFLLSVLCVQSLLSWQQSIKRSAP